MHVSASTHLSLNLPPPEYEAAMTDVERRACAGQLTLAQAREEIFALRERFAPAPGTVLQWAALARS